MKKFLPLLLVLGLCSVASAGTMVVTGLPASVNTAAGDVVLSFDIVSNGQMDNDSIYIYTYTGGVLDIASAANLIVPVDGLYDDSPDNRDYLADYVDVTNVTNPAIWADIAIPHLPVEIVGDIVTGLGLTIAQGTMGMLDVKVLSENTGAVEDVATIELIPEPVTIALLGLGGLFLRRRK